METTRTQGQPASTATAVARQKPGTGQQAPATGGFFALLSALGSAAEDGLGGAALDQGGKGLFIGKGSAVSQDGTPSPADVAQGLLQAGLLVPQGQTPLMAAASANVAQGGKVVPGALSPAAGLSGTDLAGFPSGLGTAGAVMGLVAQTAQMDAGFTDTQGLAEGGTQPMAPKAGAGLRKGAAGILSGSGAISAAQDLGQGSKSGAFGIAASGARGALDATSVAGMGMASQGQGAWQGGATPLREATAPQTAVLDTSVATGAVEALAQQAHHQNQQQDSGSRQGDMGASWVGVQASEGTQQQGPGGEFGVAMSAAEDAVAEQVTYWVTQSLQEAQVTVEHESGSVDVSVVLQGNEAHVSLRTEQAHACDVLNADQEQLRELLRQQGLELAGLTVGLSAGQQGEGRHERSSEPSGPTGRPEGAAASVTGVEPAGRVGVRVLTDRAVDLFV